MDELFDFIRSLSYANWTNFEQHCLIGMELMKNIEIHNAKVSIEDHQCFILIDSIYLYCGNHIDILINNKLLSIGRPNNRRLIIRCDMVDEATYKENGHLSFFSVYNSNFGLSIQDSIKWILDHRSTKSANN